MYEYIKILLVEDEIPLLGAMTLKLKKAGFTVLEGHNGKEGYDLAMKELPNIIITDIVMPDMDGLQMIQNIRKDQKWGISVPIILLTNLNDFNHVATAMEYGVHDYLVKSNWKLKDLLETVKNKLNLTHDMTNPTQAEDSTSTLKAPDTNVGGVTNSPLPGEPQAAPVDPSTNPVVPTDSTTLPDTVLDSSNVIPTSQPNTESSNTTNQQPGVTSQNTQPEPPKPTSPSDPNTPSPYYS